jgi:hypothetical protein
MFKRVFRIRVGAPAAVVLATVVNASAAQAQPQAVPEPAGETQSAAELTDCFCTPTSKAAAASDPVLALDVGAGKLFTPGSLLARHAAKTIHALDRLWGAQDHAFCACAIPALLAVPIRPAKPGYQTPFLASLIRSSHQHSAP